MARQRDGRVGRDDLSIDFVLGINNPTMPQIEQQDCAAILDDWVNRVANLPAEIAFMQEEIAEKDKEMNSILAEVNTIDRKIQKWVRENPHQRNPKEEEMSRRIKIKYDKVELLQAEKIALARRTEIVLDKHTLHLDTQIKQLQDRGEFPNDPDIPSLLRPQPQPQPQLRAHSQPSVAAMPLSAVTNSAIPPRHPNQHPMRTLPAQVQNHHIPGTSASAPASPAALMNQQQRVREAMAAAKRKNVTGVGIATSSSGLARHSSLTPGTPRAGTPSSARAGSAGPRAAQKGLPSKKIAPQGSKQSGVPRKSKPGKSSLSRVKRTGIKNSPSTNDSDLSDAESGSGDDDEEAVTPPANNGDGDEDMVDIDDEEGGDDKKYCTCQNVSFGDMVACDNESCPYEWFHWSCVGLKSEPVGTWICPVCTKNMKK